MGSQQSGAVMTEVQAAPRFNPTIVPMKIADRCDKCAAQAYVRVHHISGTDLQFCGHHYSRFEVAFVSDEWLVQDERDRINAKPSVSANAD